MTKEVFLKKKRDKLDDAENTFRLILKEEQSGKPNNNLFDPVQKVYKILLSTYIRAI